MTPRRDCDQVITAALAQHLASLGLVVFPPDPAADAPSAYVEDMPDQPDNAVGVFSRAGFPSPDLSGYEFPEVQVIVRIPRDTAARAGRSLAEQIRRALSRTTGASDNQVWGLSTQDEVEILTCEAGEPSPLPLGPDPSGRPRWSTTYQLETLTTEAAP